MRMRIVDEQAGEFEAPLVFDRPCVMTVFSFWCIVEVDVQGPPSYMICGGEGCGMYMPNCFGVQRVEKPGKWWPVFCCFKCDKCVEVHFQGA